ncbi:MAG TPA: D-alanyl-D-alanine carboxypeptidase/D-alanyl-D-alanine-endopeptidase [Acidimicrobiales bacterium]|nr:D-alanyl-D-alanine carboxypeptidase/D-alanyl-D-alanine-endopeptidase [Acidimicrobiales bacterium]
MISGRREGAGALPAGPRGLLLAWATVTILALSGGVDRAQGGSIDLAYLQNDLWGQLTLAGSASSAYVYDLTTHQALFSERAGVMRLPASVQKLYTATTALELMGPTARFATSVLGLGHLAPGGVWDGSLYLRGGGDPTFGSSSFIHNHYGGLGANVSTLAFELLHVAGIREVTGSIEGDESYFDSLRGEPSSEYAHDPFLEGDLSALAFNRGISGHERGPHAPAAYAARQLRAALAREGVRVARGSGAGDTPPAAVTLLQASSPTLAQLIGLMLPPSDNFFAEMLAKDLGARFAGAGTTAAGAQVVSQTIARVLDLHPRILDGSGLSEADSTSVSEVVDLLVGLAGTPTGVVLRQDMAVAGHTGTLSKRMRHTGAAGRCVGKTGTLTGVSNLVGYCHSSDDHELAFAIFMDGIPAERAHRFQDHMTITIADY